MEWKDVTTYRQGDKERIPNVWELRAGYFSVVVVREHRHFPGEIVFQVHPLMQCPARAQAADIETAKSNAVSWLKRKLKETLKDLEDK